MRKFRIGISIVLITILTGCGNSANTLDEIEQSQTEENSLGMDSGNIVDESDPDDIIEEGVFAEQTDDIAEETAETDDSFRNAF